MNSIPKLQKGDQVAIVATARKISREEIQPAHDLLKSWGLIPVLGKTIGAVENQFAGSDALRISDVQMMLDNPDIKAIWCARGGYGTVRIIDQLNFTTFKKHPKWIVGYSDVTGFHSYLHKMGFETLHAPMPVDIAKQSEEAVSCLRKALFGEKYKICYNTKDPRTRQGVAEGQLVGGNLSMLYSLCGSASALDTRGKILFLEDLDEYLYHIDRMMQNLKRNNMLENIAGLVVGGIDAMRDNTKAFGFKTDNPFGKTAKEIIAETVSEYDFPVCYDFPSGHHSDNRALILGRNITLEVGVKTSLKF
ncbi:S66 peptidase family protein [Planktosalinus lacus]|uniref:Peptidase S66 n=1 Tax=Planktosalinus lacus TaxID=1526573 RepID=A0A8J2Y8V6_9FLAO|nr:LD-carboxypeptidase [Planktosalinus lacus]GGD95584.1 peptidase S66 [Planktosalinus lacus]